MAKFKEGDKVKAKDGKVYTIGVVFGDAEKEPAYECLSPGAASRLFSESELTIANAAPIASANAVVQNAINARRARNAGMYKTEADADAAAEKFLRAARSRIGGEINTLADTYKLLGGAPLSKKGEADRKAIGDLLTGLVKLQGRF